MQLDVDDLLRIEKKETLQKMLNQIMKLAQLTDFDIVLSRAEEYGGRSHLVVAKDYDQLVIEERKK